MTTEDPSLSAFSYQMFSLATSQFIGDKSDFEVSGIFSGMLLIVGGREHMTIEDPSLSALYKTDCCP